MARKPYTYDPNSGRYRYPNGRLVPEQYVRNMILKLSRAAETEARQLASDLQNGKITVDEWYKETRENLKALYRNVSDLARGNNPYSKQDAGRLGALIKAQIQYLNKFAKGLADGTIPMDGKALVRAGMYADAANGIYEQMKRYEAMKAGMTKEKRVLGAAEHCEDCVDYAGRGWQPIGSLPPIGQSRCMSRCHCHFEYSERMTLGAQP
jgi:hypothetical protein